MANNLNKKIAGDFLNKEDKTKIIPRQMVRAYIYYHVYITEKIFNLSTSTINKVITYFNLNKADHNKIKNIIREILHRNKNLPPITFNNDMEKDPVISFNIKRKAINEPSPMKKICFRNVLAIEATSKIADDKNSFF